MMLQIVTGLHLYVPHLGRTPHLPRRRQEQRQHWRELR